MYIDLFLGACSGHRFILGLIVLWIIARIVV